MRLGKAYAVLEEVSEELRESDRTTFYGGLPGTSEGDYETSMFIDGLASKSIARKRHWYQGLASHPFRPRCALDEMLS